ncbi:MAG: PEP-utilizing enzyme [Caldilineaceae bacterium]|nr:PEP-utilizing enzyme [Caldilineaceae bacterium]
MPRSATGSPDSPPSICLLLTTPGLSLSRVGGKGLNLARMAVAGFPVPAAFIVATEAYEAFVESAGLAGWMAAEVETAATGDASALAALSDRLRDRLQASEIPAGLSGQICAAYAELGRPPVAVRSSATAEDLPGLSFAGQQETFLNVVSDDALLRAVVACWSSLWTARAIAYRARNGIDQSAVSLAVVVQEMVQSETSGVLFTANPLTGRRTETVIDATFGLGEALVGGHVEPDHYVVSSESGNILHREVGSKSTVIHGAAGGGVSTKPSESRLEEALTDGQVRQLTELGRNAADFYGDPQDIEWAFAGGRLYLLQSRPITSLFPLPARSGDGALKVYVSLGAIQGVLGPFTPLGMDMLRGLFAGIAHIFSFNATLYDQRILYSAADRPWIDSTAALGNPLGRLVYRRALPMVEPGAARAIQDLTADSRLETPRLSPRFFAVAAPFLSRILLSALQAFRNPEARGRSVHSAVEAHLAATAQRTRAARSLAERADLCEWLCYNAMFPFLLPLFIPPIIAGYASLGLLTRIASFLARTDPDITPELALELTRSLPNNVTTEMDLELWKVATRIREDSAGAAAFAASDAADLAGQYKRKQLPAAIQSALDSFLDRYGMRGLAELDFGQPRWRELPDPIIRALQSYLSFPDEEMAPDRVFQKGRREAASAEARLAKAAASAWGTQFGPWLVHLLARRLRALAGLRESPKFTMIRIMGIAREALLDSGRELVEKGVLEGADDLFYLSMRELKTLAIGAPGNWKKLISERRAAERIERRRQPIPRLLLSDGTAYFAGITSPGDADGAALAGSGVSPGVVEGTVKVVFDPLEAGLDPGDILVCPGTDPSWTPLFLAAGGLVMEVGGMMTHGSVVAREYGIPAVAGVDQATTRLQTGDRVRVDGSSGTVAILD